MSKAWLCLKKKKRDKLQSNPIWAFYMIFEFLVRQRTSSFTRLCIGLSEGSKCREANNVMFFFYLLRGVSGYVNVTILLDLLYISKAYPEFCQTVKMKLFTKIVSNWKLSTIFAKGFILDIWQGTKFASEFCEWGDCPETWQSNQEFKVLSEFRSISWDQVE